MDLEHIARQWISAFNGHNVEALVRLYAEDAVHTSPKLRLARPESNGQIAGRAALAVWWSEAFVGRPTLRYELKSVTAQGSRVFIEYERHAEGEAVMRVAELFEVRGGLIIASTVYHG